MNYVVQTLLFDGNTEFFYPRTDEEFYSECRQQAARVIRKEIRCFTAHLT